MDDASGRDFRVRNEHGELSRMKSLMGKSGDILRQAKTARKEGVSINEGEARRLIDERTSLRERRRVVVRALNPDGTIATFYEEQVWRGSCDCYVCRNGFRSWLPCRGREDVAVERLAA